MRNDIWWVFFEYKQSKRFWSNLILNAHSLKSSFLVLFFNLMPITSSTYASSMRCRFCYAQLLTCHCYLGLIFSIKRHRGRSSWSYGSIWCTSRGTPAMLPRFQSWRSIVGQKDPCDPPSRCSWSDLLSWKFHQVWNLAGNSSSSEWHFQIAPCCNLDCFRWRERLEHTCYMLHQLHELFNFCKLVWNGCDTSTLIIINHLIERWCVVKT